MNFCKIDLRKSSGLTMIALVVTIIVMMIIFGVSFQSVVDTQLIKKTKSIEYKKEFSELSEEWNIRRAELQMKGYTDDEINYTNLETATIEVGETGVYEKLIRNTVLSDNMNKMVQVKKGRLVYVKSQCSDEQIAYFKDENVPELSEMMDE